MAADTLLVPQSVKMMQDKNQTNYMDKDLTNVSSGSRRRSDAVQGMDRAYRDYVKANKVAWDRATQGMPKDAFADNVPDDIDRHGTVRPGPTHVPSRSILEDF